VPQVQVIPITLGRDCRLLSRCSEGSNKFPLTHNELAKPQLGWGPKQRRSQLPSNGLPGNHGSTDDLLEADFGTTWLRICLGV